jgi:hypothetical protein
MSEITGDELLEQTVKNEDRQATLQEAARDKAIGEGEELTGDELINMGVDTDPSPEELDDALEQDFAGVETNDEFIERRDKLVEAMMKEPLIFYKCIAENYIYLNALDTAVRKMQASGGIGGIMKMMLGRG